MKDWMLTDEEMDKAYILGSYEGDKFGHSAIAKAQARKIVQRLDEYCQDHWTLKDYRLRDNCEECWEELRKEVGS